ncbi:MAG: hypothetical protein M0Z94_19005 [Dehalococcoidales bacterium]|nr:hypothetical protein [Dehalococcoidales bacterium]
MRKKLYTALLTPSLRRAILGATVLLPLLVLLAACSSEEPQPGSTPSPSSPPAQQATATQVAQQGTATARPTTPTATPTITPSPTAVPPLKQSNVVVVWEGDLWRVAGADQQQRLTTNGGYSKPRWSADGQRIAFVRGEGTRAELGVMNADGSGRKMITTNNAEDTDPVWSPRMNTLAFTRTADTNGDGKVDVRDESEVWLVEADGSNPRYLATGHDPAWSPEGLRIAFATNGILTDAPPYRRDNAIAIVNTKGENQWSLVSVAKLPTEVKLGDFVASPGTTVLKSPAWHPNGQYMAFTSEGHTGLVLTISLRATDLKVIDARYEGGFGRAVWSPWGDVLAYEAFPPTGVDEIVVADGAGNRLGTIGGVRTGLSAVEPTWSPDGTYIAFAQLEAEPYLAMANIDGSNVKPLVWGRTRWPDWQPRGR